jgi:hypothetical protein
MQEFRVNRNLLKLIYKEDETLEAYRLYVIARTHFSKRSGLFSLDDLCDILHEIYGYSSLHSGKGNKRLPFKRKLEKRFKESSLFRRTFDGRYIVTAEKKLLLRIKGTDKSSWYMVPGIETILTKRLFRDFCVGIMLSGNKFRANKNIAANCECSVRRIQYATARNHKSGHFIKQYNFIEDISGSYKYIERLRAELFTLHGISTPKPFRYKSVWVLRLNAPNSYKTMVLCGVKGFKAQPTLKMSRKTECWFKPVRTKDKKASKLITDFKRWVFNEAVYNLDSYLADHSGFLNESLCA